MRKLVIGMALASTAIASPALARDDSWYVEADAGVTIVEDIFNLTGVNNTGVLDTKPGFDVGGIVGYDFGPFRLEAEASYRRAEERRYTVGANVYQDAAVGGGAEALSFLLNGMIDVGADDGLQGFVGAGAGVGRVKNSVIVTDRTDNVTDSDTGFAWQAIAGIRTPVSDNVDVGLKYRFYNQYHNDLINDLGQNVRTRFRSHSLLATLTYNFGGPAPAPEPVAPPPAPTPVPPPVVVAPPPPPPVCNKGPYIVFFDWDKSDVTPEAASILDSAVSAYANCNSVPIMLAGYADRSGRPAYNQALSERRNASVRSYLTARGIADAAITSQGFGENNPRVPTADGVRELQNRRVEITYGPGSGM